MKSLTLQLSAASDGSSYNDDMYESSLLMEKVHVLVHVAVYIG